MNLRLMQAIVVVYCVNCLASAVRADDWPQWLGPQRDGVWRETGIVDVFPAAGPTIRWRVPVSGGYSSPTVAGGKVFVHDRIRNDKLPATRQTSRRISAPGVERLLCLDEATGKTLWMQEYPCDYTMSYPAGPRAAPIVDGTRVYTYGAEADLQCRQVEDGKLLWAKHLSADRTPIWGFASSPLIDGDKIIVTVGDAAASLVALNKTTGQPIWSALPAREPGYSSPILITAGGTRQLIMWNPDSLNSLDPETGKVYWSEEFKIQSGLSVATPRLAGDLLYVTSFYTGSMLMRLDPAKPAASKVWKISGKNERNTAALQALICTPIIKDDFIYGVCSYGQLRCVKLLTGDRVWETFAATTGEKGPTRWANAFIIPHENRYFLFNENGDLIIAKLTPEGYQETSRAHLIEPVNHHPNRFVVWCQPAFANKCIFVRNDKEVVCASLAAEVK